MASAIFTHRIPFSLNNSKCENSVKWATWSRRRRREHVVDQTEKAGVSWDLFFGAYHFCSIKTVDLATNWCCRHHRRPRRECCQPLTRVLPTLTRVLPTNFFCQKFFCPKFFFLEIVVTRKKIFFGKKIGWQHSRRRECCQPLTRVLPTNFFGEKCFCHKIFFYCCHEKKIVTPLT